MKTKCIVMLAAVFLLTAAARAQTTAFTYQGKLTETGNPANASYDMQFRLFDNPNAGQGTQVGATVTNPSVAASGGIFTAQLDFGAAVFASGAELYLEISVRPAGSTGGYTSLAPRQRLTSAPYSIKSKSADAAATTINFTGNLSGDVSGTQGATTVNSVGGQTSANVAGAVQSINTATSANTPNTLVKRDASGDFSANNINATTQFNIGGSRVLSIAGTDNLFAGADVGTVNTGNGNSFVGAFAGYANTTGIGNSFFGFDAGGNTLTGNFNTFVGRSTGFQNQFGSNNTTIGAVATVTANNLTYATAIGAGATVSTSNSIVLGRNGGPENVGIGTPAPLSKLDVRGNVFIGLTQNPNIAGGNALFLENDSGSTSNKFRVDAAGNFLYLIGSSNAGANAGAGIIFRTAPAGGGGELDRVIINPDGTVKLNFLGDAGTPQATLCRNGLGVIAFCSSSRRYKTNIEPYRDGLNLINLLKPVTFNWKTTNQPDIGLIAEEVAEAEPRLAYKNPNGEIEGVSYSQISVVLINAVKEQQTEIEQLREQNTQLQQQLDVLKKAVCAVSREAEICQEKIK